MTLPLAALDPRAPLITSEPLAIACCVVGASVLGAALKVVDDTWDEARYPRSVGLVSFLGLTASFVALNACFATVVVSLVVGVLVAGKVDNVPFVVGTVVVLAVAAAFDVRRLEVGPGAMLAAAVACDEWLDDLCERRGAPAALRSALRWGVLWKAAAVVTAPLFGWPPRYAFAILAFDVAYAFMGARGCRPAAGGVP